MGCKFNSSHRKALEKLAKHPEYIGLKRRSVLSYSIEPVLFYRGNFHAEPDLVFFLKKKINTKTNDLIPIKVLVIEYKSNGDKRLIDKGEGQLEKNSGLLSEDYETSCRREINHWRFLSYVKKIIIS